MSSEEYSASRFTDRSSCNSSQMLRYHTILFSVVLLLVEDSAASFFTDEVKLPDWIADEYHNFRLPNVKEIPWSKLSPGQYLHTHPSADYDQGKSLAATMLSPVTTKALALDFKETEQQYELDIDFPGMNRDQINIRSDGNVLTISGERKFLKANEDGKYHKVERYYGHTRRSVAMPPNSALENITATYDQGVVHIVLPKESEQTCISPAMKKIPIT